MRIPNDLPVLRGVVLITLLLSVPVSLAVLLQNHHKSSRRASSTPIIPLSWTPTILVTDFLALLAVVSSILAYAAPALTLSVDEKTVNGPQQLIHTTTTGAAVGLTLLAGLSLVTTAYYSLYLFEAWRALRGGGTVPVWQRRLAHFYIWGCHVAPWLACTIPIQWLIREPSYMSEFMWKPSKGYLIVGVGCGLLFICVGMTFTLTLVRHTVGLLEDTHHLSPQSTHDLLSLSLKTTAFISISLLFYAYLWACFLLYEIAYLLIITTPPFHLLTLLFVQLCFNCPPPLTPSFGHIRNAHRPSNHALALAGEGEEVQRQQQRQQQQRQR